MSGLADMEERPSVVAPSDRSRSRTRLIVRVALVVVALLVVAYFATGMAGMDHAPSQDPGTPAMDHGGS